MGLIPKGLQLDSMSFGKRGHSEARIACVAPERPAVTFGGRWYQVTIRKDRLTDPA